MALINMGKLINITSLKQDQKIYITVLLYINSFEKNYETKATHSRLIDELDC